MSPITTSVRSYPTPTLDVHSTYNSGNALFDLCIPWQAPVIYDKQIGI